MTTDTPGAATDIPWSADHAAADGAPSAVHGLQDKAATAVHSTPRIVVIGVGGAGCNAVNNMIEAHLEGVEFVVANTDAQSLAQSRADRRVQLGLTTTEGLGSGARPDVGSTAARETLDTVVDQLRGAHMVFITAGMGGGTGTGAAPVIARAARKEGILTVGVVTKPFEFEGAHRMALAEDGIAELRGAVDTLIVIPNQNLFRICDDKTTFRDAFRMADDVLYCGVRGVTDLMVMPGLINLDFADIRTVIGEMGQVMLGLGEASGEGRAIEAATLAMSNPLLDDVAMQGAKAVLINITGGLDMTLYEVDEAANRIRHEVDPDANIILGSAFDESLDGLLRVSLLCTGIDATVVAAPAPPFHAEAEVYEAAGAPPAAIYHPAFEAAAPVDAAAGGPADDLSEAAAVHLDEPASPAGDFAEPAIDEPSIDGGTEDVADTDEAEVAPFYGEEAELLFDNDAPADEPPHDANATDAVEPRLDVRHFDTDPTPADGRTEPTFMGAGTADDSAEPTVIGKRGDEPSFGIPTAAAEPEPPAPPVDEPPAAAPSAAEPPADPARAFRRAQVDPDGDAPPEAVRQFIRAPEPRAPAGPAPAAKRDGGPKLEAISSGAARLVAKLAGLTAAKRGDYSAALAELQPLTEQGDAASQYNLGEMHARGDGVPQNFVEARHWLYRAAMQHNVFAQFELASLYEKGRGVAADLTQAFMWYQVAANNGHEEAAERLEIVQQNMSSRQLEAALERVRHWQPDDEQA